MKYLLRTLLVAALPYIIREIVKRLDAPARPASGRRRGVIIEGEKLS